MLFAPGNIQKTCRQLRKRSLQSPQIQSTSVWASAHAIHRATSGLDPHKIVPEIVQLLLDSGLSGFADGDDTDDRRNPDRYSQDRQDSSCSSAAPLWPTK